MPGKRLGRCAGRRGDVLEAAPGRHVLSQPASLTSGLKHRDAAVPQQLALAAPQRGAQAAQSLGRLWSGGVLVVAASLWQRRQLHGPLWLPLHAVLCIGRSPRGAETERRVQSAAHAAQRIDFEAVICGDEPAVMSQPDAGFRRDLRCSAQRSAQRRHVGARRQTPSNVRYPALCSPFTHGGEWCRWRALLYMRHLAGRHATDRGTAASLPNGRREGSRHWTVLVHGNQSNGMHILTRVNNGAWG